MNRLHMPAWIVVGPMPAHGEIVKSTDDMWKIITWINSLNQDAVS